LLNDLININHFSTTGHFYLCMVCGTWIQQYLLQR